MNDKAFESLLEYLKLSRGFDFTGYKRSSLMRRVKKRMQEVGTDAFGGYQDYLEVHPDEFTMLFNTILINVTSFFRDPQTWTYLSEEIIPKIIAGKKPDENIRVWSGGCASGEEAYSLAIVLAEALGREEFVKRVKIYATDVDEEALTRARHATYSDREIQNVPEEFRNKYFESAGGSYVFRSDLRRSVIFGRHDLIQDAPIPHLDLLLCRNTLMYLNAETQGRILSRFHFALNDNGYLFLGKAESLLTRSNLFVPVDMKARIFSKVPKINMRNHLITMVQAGGEEVTNRLARQIRIRDAALDTTQVAEIAVDSNGIIMLINDKARSLFDLSANDIGRPLQDMEISYKPVELRSVIEQAYSERRQIKFTNVERALQSGAVQYLDVTVAPLYENGGTVIGAVIAFNDVSHYKRLQDELQRSNQELETAYEELQSSNEELQTTNEELQSSNEELETTNEELQSSNEELETMNEELQSTNEELQTMNDELRLRTNELNNANIFMRSILTSLRIGVIVVDCQMKVVVWNRKSEDLWGLREDEVKEQFLLNLDIGLPVESLKGMVNNCIAGEASQEMLLDATTRRGKSIRCHVTCNPLLDVAKTCQGAVLLVEEENK